MGDSAWNWKSEHGSHGKPMPSLKIILQIIFWAIIAFILIQAFISEKKHMLCYLANQCSCISPYYRIAPQEGDDNVTLLQKTENGIRLPEETVNWRRTLVLSIILAFVGSFVFKRGFPSIPEFIVFVIITYVILFSIQNWYEMHIWYRVREQQLRTVDQLRTNLGYMTPSTACGVYGPSDTTGFDFQKCPDNNCSCTYKAVA